MSRPPRMPNNGRWNPLPCKVAVKPRTSTPRRKPEENAQGAWAKWARMQYPGIRITATLGGFPFGMLPDPVRWRLIQIIRNLGYEPGVQDCLVFRPSGSFHGLFVEWKSERGGLSEEQRQYQDDMRAQGYCAYAVRSFEAGQDLLRTYLTDPCRIANDGDRYWSAGVAV